MTMNNHDRKEGRSANIGFAKWRVQYFYESLVQGSSSVFQMNICAENPPLRQGENRQAVKKLTQKEKQFEYLSEKNFIQPILRDTF